MVLSACAILIFVAVYLLEYKRRFRLLFDKEGYSEERMKLIEDYISNVKSVSEMSKVERKRHIGACDNLGIVDIQLDKWYKDNNMQLN